MYRYASKTKVTVDASRMEIERYLRKAGADEFASGFTPAKAMIQFRARGYRVRMEIPLQEKQRGKDVPISDIEERRRWRALLLVLKAKFAAIDSKVAEFHVEFLPYLVTQDQTTIAEEIARAGLGLMLDGRVKMLPAGES